MPKNFNDFLISKALESKKLADEILKMQIKLDQEKDLKKIDLKGLKRSHKKLKAASQLLFQSSLLFSFENAYLRKKQIDEKNKKLQFKNRKFSNRLPDFEL